MPPHRNMWLFCVGKECEKMSFIEVKNISKTFKVAKKSSGLKESIKSFLKREYHEIKAVDNVSFSIRKGEIIGYIGPNGAGKSTTIKILSGILTPSSGTCKISGIIPWEKRKEYVKKNWSSIWPKKSTLVGYSCRRHL